MKKEALILATFVTAIIVAGSIFGLSAKMSYAQVPADNVTSTASPSSNVTSMVNSSKVGAIAQPNFDIVSVDFTLPDGSSVSPDFRAIYIKSINGPPVLAQYDDYELPSDVPKFKPGQTVEVNAYSNSLNSLKPENIQLTAYPVVSGETSNLTKMKLGDPITLSSNDSATFTIPDTSAGKYILDTFVDYPSNGITQVNTIGIMINPK